MKGNRMSRATGSIAALAVVLLAEFAAAESFSAPELLVPRAANDSGDDNAQHIATYGAWTWVAVWDSIGFVRSGACLSNPGTSKHDSCWIVDRSSSDHGGRVGNRFFVVAMARLA